VCPSPAECAARVSARHCAFLVELPTGELLPAPTLGYDPGQGRAKLGRAGRNLRRDRVGFRVKMTRRGASGRAADCSRTRCRPVASRSRGRPPGARRSRRERAPSRVVPHDAPQDGAATAAGQRTGRCIGRRLGARILRAADSRRSGHAHNPTGLPSGSANIANRPKSPGRSVGGTSRLPPSFSARSRYASRSSTRM
jgi:hypothetical protein